MGARLSLWTILLCVAFSCTARSTSAVIISFDYSYDTAAIDGATGFFDTTHTYTDGSTGTERRLRLEQAGSILASQLDDSLLAIAPDASNTWTPTFNNPATG